MLGFIGPRYLKYLKHFLFTAVKNPEYSPTLRTFVDIYPAILCALEDPILNTPRTLKHPVLLGSRYSYIRYSEKFTSLSEVLVLQILSMSTVPEVKRRTQS